MATIELIPIITKTNGGFPAEVTGLDPSESNCIIGTVTLPTQKRQRVQWSATGICRNKPQEYDLVNKSRKLSALIKVAGALSKLVKHK